MIYAFVKYWVEGEQEAIQTLFEAIKNGEELAENSLKNLGVNTEKYDTGDAHWLNPELIEKDGQKVLYFEEFYPNERGTIIDKLFEEEQFDGKLSTFYFYFEEGTTDTFLTNDLEGKYFPYHIVAQIIGYDGEIAECFYTIDKEQLISQIRERYQLDDNLNSIETLENYFDNSKDYDYLYVNGIFVSLKDVKEREERESKYIQSINNSHK